MKKLLFVDDEVQILKSFRRVFIDTDYEVITANSGVEALDILEKTSVDLIISDMRMPEIDGYDLLLKVKQLYPKTSRIILSGYSDEKVVFKALRNNIAKVYMFKPWSNDEIVVTINNLFTTLESIKNNNLLSLLNTLEHLPTIPGKYLEIIDLIERDANIEQISDLIETDPAIASEILHVANSAYYGGKTGSIKQAITTIGLNCTRELVLSTSVINMFKSDKGAQNMLELAWEMSYLVNKLTLFIYKKILNRKIPSLYQSAGLLHNLGVVFLLSVHGKSYMEILLNSSNDKQLIDKEKELMHSTHMEAGGHLLNWWGFPYAVVEGALYHHNPYNPSIINKDLVKVLHLAQYYANLMIGQTNDDELDLQLFIDLETNKQAFEEKLKSFKKGGRYV